MSKVYKFWIKDYNPDHSMLTKDTANDYTLCTRTRYLPPPLERIDPKATARRDCYERFANAIKAATRKVNCENLYSWYWKNTMPTWSIRQDER
jgi:hypothetical protein